MNNTIEFFGGETEWRLCIGNKGIIKDAYSMVDDQGIPIYMQHEIFPPDILRRWSSSDSSILKYERKDMTPCHWAGRRVFHHTFLAISPGEVIITSPHTKDNVIVFISDH